MESLRRIASFGSMLGMAIHAVLTTLRSTPNPLIVRAQGWSSSAAAAAK